jgi:hypothetical protein
MTFVLEAITGQTKVPETKHGTKLKAHIKKEMGFMSLNEYLFSNKLKAEENTVVSIANELI